MVKKVYILIVLVGLALVGTTLLYFYAPAHLPSSSADQKIKVVTSVYPLGDFAHNVGRDLVAVVVITPPGAEPHDYEPTPQDIAQIYSADLFILNGNGVDAWAEKIKEDLVAHGVHVLTMSGLRATPSLTDPHAWLDPLNAQQETVAIADRLRTIDPPHALIYTQNQNIFKAQLAELDQRYQISLAQCANRLIVTSHNAFAYLAKRYNLTQLYIAGISPDEEPSPQTIAAVAQTARARNIHYIFFETLVSPKLAQTIAAEIGAQTLVLNPIEGLTADEINAGKNYISVMDDNLQNLKIALDCHAGN